MFTFKEIVDIVDQEFEASRVVALIANFIKLISIAGIKWTDRHAWAGPDDVEVLRLSFWERCCEDEPQSHREGCQHGEEDEIKGKNFRCGFNQQLVKEIEFLKGLSLTPADTGPA